MKIVVRPIMEKDAKHLNEIRLQRNVMQYILSIPSETIEKQVDFIESVDGINNHALVAEVLEENGECKTVGYAGIHVNTGARLRHSASLGIMVNENYHNLGVGTKLMESIVDIADNWLMLVRIELHVFVENKKAIAFYEKFDFEIEGLKRKGSIRLGEYADEYIMARIRE